MRSLFFLPALVAGVLAAPHAAPQDIDLASVVDSVPTPSVLGPPVTALSQTPAPTQTASLSEALAAPAVTPDAGSKKLRARTPGDCAPQPAGTGPGPSNSTFSDSVAGFQNYAPFATLANNAVTPSPYSLIFQNLNGSLNQAGYLALKTISAYNPALCSAYCDSTAGCESFNIYIERDPTLDPGTACPNPPGLTNFKCTLYSTPISAAAATNVGQYRGPNPPFQVVITGSNGYSKFTPPIIPGFTGPEALNCAINAPDSYLGYKFFSGDLAGFNVTLCADACTSQTAYNSRHPNADGSYETCTFFNAYALLENNVYSGITCSLYSRGFGIPYNVNCGQTRGANVYTVIESFGYNLTAV